MNTHFACIFHTYKVIQRQQKTVYIQPLLKKIEIQRQSKTMIETKIQGINQQKKKKRMKRDWARKRERVRGREKNIHRRSERVNIDASVHNCICRLGKCLIDLNSRAFMGTWYFFFFILLSFADCLTIFVNNRRIVYSISIFDQLNWTWMWLWYPKELLW